MKVLAHSNQLDTNVNTTDSKEFGIGDASVVIEILRNRLYENKIQTLVQEYICNARDAMREVGKDNEFNVTMPTRLQPTFKVRDFGPGISPERMDKVFRLYGSSTKRGSNNQTGGFGIGAKSAWSYTDSFTVVTCIDGTRRTYVCHTGNSNTGSIDLISTDHTDEMNGTEIQVAVKQNDLGEFREAVYRAIYFWEKRPVLNAASDEMPTLCSGYRINANIETIHRDQLPRFLGLQYQITAMAVIDGVPYPLTEKLLNKATKLKAFLEGSLTRTAILHFSNGIVEVSASRESIADSAFSIDALNRMGTQGTKDVTAHLKSEFAKVKNTGEWIATYKVLVSYFHVQSEAKYGDYRIEHGRIISENLLGVKMTLVHDLDKRGRHKTDKITKDEMNAKNSQIPIDLLDNIYFVTTEETKIIQNKRLREFFSTQRNPSTSKAFLLEVSGGDKETLAKVVRDLNVKAFESIEYPVVERQASVKVERENEEFCMHSFLGTRHKYTTLARNTQKYLYVEMKDGTFQGYSASNLHDLSSHLNSNEQIQVVGLAPRALKMVQGNENFSPLKDWLSAYKPTKAEINFTISDAALNRDELEALFEVTEIIKDEFLNAMIKEYKGIIGEKRKVRSIPDMLIAKVKEATNAKEFVENDAKLKLLLAEKYPLVGEVGRYSRNKNELAFYINAKYTN